MIKVLVVSDIHGKQNVFQKIKAFEKPDLIISAGDHLLPQKFMEANFDFFVDGNNDWDNFNQQELDFKIANVSFHLEHGHNYAYSTLWDEVKMLKIAKQQGCQIWINGHSHMQLYVANQNVSVLNPGSIAYARGKSDNGYAMIYINEQDSSFTIELKSSSHFI